MRDTEARTGWKDQPVRTSASGGGGQRLGGVGAEMDVDMPWGGGAEDRACAVNLLVGTVDQYQEAVSLFKYAAT